MNRSSTEMLQLTIRGLTTDWHIAFSSRCMYAKLRCTGVICAIFKQKVRSSNQRPSECLSFDRRHVMVELAVRLKGAGVNCGHPSSLDAV